jgi:hypothetical protein
MFCQKLNAEPRQKVRRAIGRTWTYVCVIAQVWMRPSKVAAEPPFARARLTTHPGGIRAVRVLLDFRSDQTYGKCTLTEVIIAMKPTFFLRSAAVLTLLLGMGHMIGKPWTPSKDPQAATVAAAMSSHRMHVMGFDRTFMDFYVGFGLMLGVYLLAQAALLWMLAGLSSIEPARARQMAAVFFITNVGQTILSGAYLFTLPLVLSGIVALCLGAAVVIPSGASRQAARLVPPNE